MDIKNLLVNKSISIKEAIEKLDITGEKIVLVVEKTKLIGVVTDGDIRRWILKNGSIKDSIKNIMNESPKYVLEENKEDAEKMMSRYKIEAIPIVNENKEVIDIIFWNEIFKNQFKYCKTNNVPVVIMAGGRGTRLHPYTKIIPKMLMPIGDIPIIERILNKFLEFDFINFYISINYKKEIIKAYFSKEREYNISLVEENKPLGTAGSLYLLKDKIKETFFVSNCDILVDANYSEILKFHKKNNNKITIITALKNFTIPYGIFDLDELGNVKGLDEKPSYEFLVNTGMYILEPEVLDFISEEKYFDMTEIIKLILVNKDNVGIYPVTENAWLDMGEFESMKNMIEKLERE